APSPRGWRGAAGRRAVVHRSGGRCRSCPGLRRWKGRGGTWSGSRQAKKGGQTNTAAGGQGRSIQRARDAPSARHPGGAWRRPSGGRAAAQRCLLQAAHLLAGIGVLQFQRQRHAAEQLMDLLEGKQLERLAVLVQQGNQPGADPRLDQVGAAFQADQVGAIHLPGAHPGSQFMQVHRAPQLQGVEPSVLPNFTAGQEPATAFGQTPDQISRAPPLPFSIMVMANAETTKVIWMSTYHMSLSFSICWAFMNMRSRWMEEIATMLAATFIFREPESILPSQSSFSVPALMFSWETKFSKPEIITITSRPPTSAMSISDSSTRIRSASLRSNTWGSR